MKKFKYLLIICHIFVTTFVYAADAVNIEIIKTEEGSWSVNYKVKDKVGRIAFDRNPDNSRTTRWISKSDEIMISFQDNKEYIVRKDGKLFDQARFFLTPSYIHLSKDYGPFSPYSDGGSLIHSGRFFACIDSCNNENQIWKLSLTVPKGEHIVVNGKIHQSSVNWLDRNSGQNVYAGKQTPIETAEFIAVIDQGLPLAIKESLDRDLPSMTTYFEERLGELAKDKKPTLYASYANIEGQSAQGGTLPNQIFMHWNVNDLHSQVKKSSFINGTTWFFAHEVAHLYQSGENSRLDHEDGDSWIHEGNADFLASELLLDSYPKSNAYVAARFEKSKARCITGLNKLALIEAANKNEFRLYYSCGLLIHKAIDREVKRVSNSKNNIYSVWNRYRKKVKAGAPANQSTFLSVVGEFSGTNIVNQVSKMVNSRLDDPKEFIDHLSN